jgi:N-acetyl-anhydromuramyl-L-alanine amidase AmpD
MNKTGLHIISGFSGALGQPRVVKLVEASVEYVRQVRQEVGPACIIVVRWHEPEQPLSDPVAAARAWFQRRQPAMKAMAENDRNVAFEGYNEVGDGQAAAYAAFEVERLRLMHQAGLRAVVGNFSVGTPHESLWGTAYKPMLAAMGPGDFLGLHEYWQNTAELDNRWLCGRWTLMPELKGVPIIITELGRESGGWRASSNPAQYLAELEKYNAIMEASPNVLGGVVFTAGGQGWDAYHPDEIWPQVVGKYTGAPWTDPSHPQTQVPGVPYYCTERVDAAGKRYAPQYIVIHGTEAPRDAALASWKVSSGSPSGQSMHDLVTVTGLVVHCVPYDKAACHLSANIQIPGFNQPAADGRCEPPANVATIAVALECAPAPADPGWAPTQIESAVALVRRLAETYQIPRERILRHSDLDPKNAADPRDLPWQLFVARVFQLATDEFSQATRNAAWNAGGIPYNRDAAFPRFARELNLGNPETPEFDFQLGGVWHRGQGFSKGIVYAQIGHWDECDLMPW